MMTQKLAYTFDEAAEQCGYSVGTVKHAVADGDLATRYLNAEGVIRHEDLAAWIGQLPTKPNNGTSPANEAPKPRAPRQAMTAQLPLPEREGEWLTAEDLSKAWQLSPGTVTNWRSQNKGPEFIHIGGVVRYHRDAVAAWLGQQPK
jgi:hypothetical protein